MTFALGAGAAVAATGFEMYDDMTTRHWSFWHALAADAPPNLAAIGAETGIGVAAMTSEVTVPTAAIVGGGLAILFVFFIVAGSWFVVFLLSLRRELPAEARARRQLQEWQARQEPTPSHHAKGERHPHLPPATG